MPPKGKSQQVTVEMLHECNERISSSEKPDEADYKTLLSAANGSEEAKEIAVQIIPRYADKFPSQAKAGITAMLALSKSENVTIRKKAIKGIIKFYQNDKESVSKALLNALGDSDEMVKEFALDYVKRYVQSDEEFRKILLESLKSQTPEAQCVIVGIIRDEFQFSEENVPQLIDIIKIALKSCVVEGLRLYGRNKKLISEEQAAPLIDNLLELLNNSLESNFDNVVNTLMIQILKFTKTIGDPSTVKLLNILQTHVMPKFDKLPIEVKIAIMQRIVNVTRSVESEEFLNLIYNNVFMKFPKTPSEINCSLVEATLFAFYRLAQRFNKAASKLIGTVLVQTGQPGEADEVGEDENKQKEFRERLENLQTISVAFVDKFKSDFEALKDKKTDSEEETKEKFHQLKLIKRAQRTGINIGKLCRTLLSKNPLTGKAPKTPSWNKYKGKNNKFNKGKFNHKFNGNRNYNSRTRSIDRNGRNRSREYHSRNYHRRYDN